MPRFVGSCRVFTEEVYPVEKRVCNRREKFTLLYWQLTFCYGMFKNAFIYHFVHAVDANVYKRQEYLAVDQ